MPDVRFFVTLAVALLTLAPSRADDKPSWPPALKGAKNGTVTQKTDDFLKVPEAVEKSRKTKGYADFVVAKEAPSVDLAYHRDLGPDAVKRRLWSSWGDVCVAS